MPCSLLLALGLLTTPECYSSLADHTVLQWNPQHEQLVTFGKPTPETLKAPRIDAIGKTGPAVAEKYKTESTSVEKRPNLRPIVVPAIAERAPQKLQPNRNELKMASPAIAQKNVRVAAPITEVAPMDLSSIALSSPDPVNHVPAVAERLEKRVHPKQNPEEWQQVAQAWPSLPPHVRSEILRLVQNAE